MTIQQDGIRHRELLRRHALASGLVSLLAAISIFKLDFFFPRITAYLTFLAAAGYFAYYFLFGRLCDKGCSRAAGVLLSQLGVLVITIGIACSGGVISPFIFLYFSMLVAEALYGLENPYTMPSSLAGYLVVVCGNCLGFIPNIVPWAHEIYKYPVAVTFFALFTSAYIVLTGKMASRILAGLRLRLAAEASEKEELIRKFSELNSTTQLGVLAHRIAHDLRSPIASISGYLEVQSASETDPERKSALSAMEETVDELVRTLQNITRFGKPSSPTIEVISLDDFFRNLVAIAAYSPKSRGVDMTPVFGSKDLKVAASRSELQQAFFNLLKNAVEAVADNADSRQIAISVSREGKDIRVSVADNGPGMPEELLKTVFRKSVTTKKDGTGVGLIITRDLLMRNNGDIKLHNRESGGLEAVVTLTAE